MQLLLRIGNDKFIFPNGMPDPPNTLPDLNSAIDSAITYRPDIKVSLEQINNAEKNLISYTLTNRHCNYLSS